MHARDHLVAGAVIAGTLVLFSAAPAWADGGGTIDVTNPATGEVDLQTLKMIRSYRGRQVSIWGLGANLGIYAAVHTPGTETVGDALEVEPR